MRRNTLTVIGGALAAVVITWAIADDRLAMPAPGELAGAVTPDSAMTGASFDGAPTVDYGAVIRGVRPRGFGGTAYALVTPVAGRRTFYVAMGGSDADPGSRERPFRTIGKAAQVAMAGDVVTIRPGTYDESVRVENSGEPGKPIVFQAERRGTVVLTGGTHTFQSVFWTGAPEPTGQFYVTVRGLIFRRYSDPLSTESAIAAVRASRGWVIEDNLFDEAGRTGVEIRGSDVLITRSTFQNNYVNALMAWGRTSKATSPSDPRYTPIVGLRISDVIIRGNNMTPTPLVGDVAEYVAKIWGTQGTVIDNVESYENNGPGLWFDTRNRDFQIRNSYFHDNRPVAGVSTRGRGLFIEVNWAPGLIENNVILNNSGAGITVANSSGVEIRGNLLAGNAHCVAFISADRGSDTNGNPIYPLSNVSIDGNRCRDWKGLAAIATLGGTFESPATMGIRANADVYDPLSSTALVAWSGVGTLTTLADVRRKLGWEMSGRIAPVPVPVP